MSIQISSPIQVRAKGADGFSVKTLDSHTLSRSGSALVALDDFRVSGHSFPPHPHAGFAAVTYVFEDSAGGLRSADSLGNDVQIGPGGIVWTHAGSGVIHHEVQADHRRELHGLQFFVNLSPTLKLSAPQTLSLDAGAVPEWRSERHDRVRVVVGNYQGVVSSLSPPEAFTLLDVELRSSLQFTIESSQIGWVYVESGSVEVGDASESTALSTGQAVMLSGSGQVVVSAHTQSRILFLRSVANDAPIVMHGPFIMNTQTQIAEAMARYDRGEMGRLSPLQSNYIA